MAIDQDRHKRVLLLIYSRYAAQLPTHVGTQVLARVKAALWPDGDRPTVPEARAERDVDRLGELRRGELD